MRPFFSKAAVLARPISAVAAALVCSVAFASLPVGSPAPDFTTQAALGGKVFSFSLAEALRKGPVVLYFYPKSFTAGCTVEAHDFAEAAPRFHALGASVLGISHDDIRTQQEFSVRECRNKFPVAADADAAIIHQYDAGMAILNDTADRISYVIAPDGKVLYVYSSLNPDHHVENTLKALADWKRRAGVAR